MSSFVDKVAGLLPDLEARGTVYLFALAEQTDVERWDVVISSEWSDRDWTAAVRTVVDLLKPRLTPEEITMISRIAVILSSDPKVQEMPASLDGVVPENSHVINVPLLGSDVRRAFIFKAQHPPAVLPGEESLADVVAHS